MIKRNFVLRFRSDVSRDWMNAVVAGWNRRLAEYFPGRGYFPSEPVIETLPDEYGQVGWCYAYYLHCDTEMWAAIAKSRTLTPDEPVIAEQLRQPLR